jgi:hypothetical protein
MLQPGVRRTGEGAFKTSYMISVGERTISMTKSIEEAKIAKAAKAKAVRLLKAEQRVKAMIALSEERGKLFGDDILRECMEQDEARRLAVSCEHR